MSAVGVGLGLAANAGLVAGGIAAANWATGGFGEDAARDINRGANKQINAAETGQEIIGGATQGAQAGLAPYQQAGTNALRMQEAISGALGPEAQAQAYQALQASPMFASMLEEGQRGILANASATGGLRGGDTQGALAQLGPQILQQLIQQQYGQLSGLSGMGFGAAGQSGQFGLQGAGAQAGLQQDIGAYQAGGIIGQTQARLAGRQQALGYGLQAAGTLGSLATGMPMGGGAASPGAGQAPMPQGTQPTWSY